MKNKLLSPTIVAIVSEPKENTYPNVNFRACCRDSGAWIANGSLNHVLFDLLEFDTDTPSNLQPFYFTFGSGHFDDNHESLGKFYVIVKADSYGKARNIFSAKRGDKFSSCYCYEDYENIKHRFTGMLELPFEELTPQNGPTR